MALGRYGQRRDPGRPACARSRRRGGSGFAWPHFFIERPIFAAVISIIIVILGVIAYPTLAGGAYPGLAPPTVIVFASYPGANAQTMAEVFSQPLEEAINGVENMTYHDLWVDRSTPARSRSPSPRSGTNATGAGAGAEPGRDGRLDPAEAAM